jgi:hypothetical protein
MSRYTRGTLLLPNDVAPTFQLDAGPEALASEDLRRNIATSICVGCNSETCDYDTCATGDSSLHDRTGFTEIETPILIVYSRG